MNLLSSDRLVRTAVYSLAALLTAMLWGFAGIAKLTAGGVPSWFGEQFGGTLLSKFPGLFASFYSIALLETTAAGLALASLLRGEFLRAVHPTFLQASLLASLLLFVQLSFGKQLLSDFDGIHDLYMYFAGTLVTLAMVRRLHQPSTQAHAG